MTLEESLIRVLDELERNGIAYMITGSFASNLHGVPRTTQDADVIIKTDANSLARFVKALQKDFYADENAAKEAFSENRMFNIIHYETGFKVDLIIRKSRPFSRREFNRRQKVLFLGGFRWFATAEDIILAKLEWSQMGSSERQFKDAVDVATMQGEKLDHAYLEAWAQELGLSELLKRLIREIGMSQVPE